MLACLICFGLGRIVHVESGVLFPFVEELIKCLPFLFYIGRKKVAFLTESVVYGAAVGAGFSFLENILYVVLSQEFTIGDAILRGFGTALLHIGCTALFATTAMMISRVTVDKSQAVKVFCELVCIIPAGIIHALYNQFLLPEFLQLLLTVLVIAGLIYYFFTLDEKLITRWLDSCISNDIALYTAIRQGHLRETNAGQYLLDVKSKFQPEVFFDILMYLSLYLEISIAAKSRMLMREAGIDMDLSYEEKAADKAKYAEFQALRSSIGATGLYILGPIVKEKTVDDWIVKELM